MGKKETIAERIPVSEKLCLTVEEAAAYSGIGTAKIREMAKAPHCGFVLYNGSRMLIKRKPFESYILKQVEV